MGGRPLSRPEQVKAFRLLGTEWTAASESSPPTLKLKRLAITAKYADVIERPLRLTRHPRRPVPPAAEVEVTGLR